ncbi:MAG: S8 family serine peptidase [Candidatus Thorarchaeota archaeon]
MNEEIVEPTRKRGTALLVITIIIISSFVLIQAIPRIYPEPGLNVRVAIIDSGINKDAELEPRVVAEKSFINTTYGYPESDNTTSDSRPSGSLHGTFIAKIIAQGAPDAGLVNAKVVGSDDVATPSGIVAAIHWAVTEENCSIINLSLGMELISGDIIGDAVRWAFHRGVCVIAAAGNNGQGGVSGSSIESPAIYPEVIAVAGIDELLTPYSFSGRGPLRDRIMKPDIAARGYYVENGGTVFGTSFAAPVVSAGAAVMIALCLENNWVWTPGLIKATILASASKMSFENWEVGVGRFDLETALIYLDNAHKEDGLPLISAVSPIDGPFSFERWFVNHSVYIPVSIFSSSNVTFNLAYRGGAADWLTGPSEVMINQSGLITLELCVISSGPLNNLEAWVSFIAPGYLNVGTYLKFGVGLPFKEIAFDFSTTPWAMDSIYGQFRELAAKLTTLGFSIDEIRSQDEINVASLSRYDAVFVFDPCAWDYVQVNNSVIKVPGLSYTPTKINSYVQYWEQGGSLFLVGLSNMSLDLSSANNLFSEFNITLNYDRVPAITIIINGMSSTTEIVNMIEHPITDSLPSFDYNGCSLNITGDVFRIAWAEVSWLNASQVLQTENRTVLAGLEGPSGGRVVATGSNFFLDNWALNNLYLSTENYRLVLQALFWLVHTL